MATAEQMAQRYLDGTGSANAQKKYKEGIDAVAESPMAKAAAALPLYLQRVQEAVSSGRMANALMGASFSRWKENAKAKGAERYATGCRLAADKMRAHFSKWAGVYNNIKAEVSNMPKGTTEDSIARVRRSIEMMKAAAGK